MLQHFFEKVEQNSTFFWNPFFSIPGSGTRGQPWSRVGPASVSAEEARVGRRGGARTQRARRRSPWAQRELRSGAALVHKGRRQERGDELGLVVESKSYGWLHKSFACEKLQ
jgi:hypothetical protein